jgi:hypothetical protein
MCDVTLSLSSDSPVSLSNAGICAVLAASCCSMLETPCATLGCCCCSWCATMGVGSTATVMIGGSLISCWWRRMRAAVDALSWLVVVVEVVATERVPLDAVVISDSLCGAAGNSEGPTTRRMVPLTIRPLQSHSLPVGTQAQRSGTQVEEPSSKPFIWLPGQLSQRTRV